MTELADVLIAGLTLRIEPHDQPTYFGGPVMSALRGAQASGMSVQCRTALGRDVSDSEAMALLESAGSGCIARVSRLQPVFRASPIMGQSTGSASDVSAFAYPLHGDQSSTPLILVNADPRWHLAFLKASNPNRAVLIDLYAPWATLRRRELASCLAYATAVTGTAKEFSELTSECQYALSAAVERGALIVTKRGADGISIHDKFQKLSMPAPQIRRVRTDIGAGDLLAGALGAGFENGRATVEAFTSAYRKAEKALSALLGESSGEERPFNSEARDA